MSESPKMGLFGSKDDNTETTDEKKVPVKPDETSQERSAPYNIDSDSEAYDTEALSIMDINDIIGIQAESAGDSTLESEIAALSEVITDIKNDDLASGSKTFDAKGSNIGRSDSNRDIGSTKDKRSEKDSPKEDVCSQVDDSKSPNSAGMAGINKSLQLIGEAYDSDDSEDTDTNEIPCTSELKSDSVSESLEAQKNKDHAAAAKNYSKAETTVGDQVEPKPKIVDECSMEKDAASDKPVESAMIPVEDDLENMQTDKSADMTDSAIDISTKQPMKENKTETMDVDFSITHDVENVPVEKPPCNNPEKSESIAKIPEKSTIELTVVNTENLPVEPVIEAEEPMEVDQPNDEVSDSLETETTDAVATDKVSDNIEIEKADDIAAEKASDKVQTEKAESVATEIVSDKVQIEKADATEDKPFSSDLIIPEVAAKVTEIVNQPEESEKSMDKILNDKICSPETVIREESLNDQVSEAETSNSDTKEVLAPANIEGDLKQSIDSPKTQEIAAEKLEMETEDSEVEESFTEKVEVNSPVVKIVESVAAEQTHSATEDNKLVTLTEKATVDKDKSPENLTRVGELSRLDVTLTECDKAVDNEPMEVDDNVEYHKTESDKKGANVPDLSDNFVDTVKPVTDTLVTLKQNESVDTALDTLINCPEHVETAEIKTVLDSTVRESDKNETIVTTLVPSENSAEIGESTLDIPVKESDQSKTTEISSELTKNSAGIDESISNITLKECVKDETSVASESSKHSAEIIESVGVATSKDSAEEKIIESEIGIPGNSSVAVEAMETEDITLEKSSEEVLAASASESSEKSLTVVDAVADIIPRVRPIIATEETAVEDEKMEIDGSTKKKTQKDEESDILRPDVASPESEKLLVPAVQEGSSVEEKSTIQEAYNSDKIEHLEKTQSTAGKRSEIEAPKNIDETDEANQESREEENVSSFTIQKSETSTEKILEIRATETTDNVTAEIAQDENEKVKSESKTTENVPSIVIEESKSSSENIHGDEAIEIADNVMTEVAEEEHEEIKSELKKEENVSSIVVQEAESSTDKIHEIQAAETGDNVMVEVTGCEEKEDISELKKEEKVPSIVIEESESSSEKVCELQATESANNVTAEVGTDEKEEIKLELKKEEHVTSILIQEAEISAEKMHEILPTETPNVMKEITEEEETEIKLQPNEVEFITPSKGSESVSEKSPETEIEKAPDEPMDEDTDDKENSVKLKAEEAKPSITMDISEASPDKIHTGGETETSDETIQEAVQKDDEESQLKPNVDETVHPAAIEKSESLTEIHDVQTPEVSAVITGKNIESETNAAETITTEKEKESVASVENVQTLGVKSGIEIAEAPEATIKNVETEKDKAKVESMETPMSEDEEFRKVEETPTEMMEKPMDDDLEDQKEDNKSESKEVETKSPISAEVISEVPEKPEIEKSQSGAEESTSTIQQETNQNDLSSSSINLDDIEGEEDPVEEEMNLSLEPEITESEELNSRKDADEEVQRIGELPLEPADSKETEEVQANIDLSLESEEKADEFPNVRDDPLDKLVVEDSVGDSSKTSDAKKQEQCDERLEKPTEDDDDNSKEVLSSVVHAHDIFHDEQSQNTQEMMDSILETDSSNFNKVLDDEEGMVGAALACANNLPLEETEMDELTDKLPSESEEILNKALDDPMSAQNIDSLEGLLDLDLIQEGDEATLKSVDPIVAKVMNEAEEDSETKDVDVSLLLEETDQGESVDRDEYVSASEESITNKDVDPKIFEEEAIEIATPAEKIFPQAALNDTIDLPVPLQLETAVSSLTENDAVFELPIVEPSAMVADEPEPNAIEANQLTTEDSKLELAEDLLREIAVDDEGKMELAGELLLEAPLEKDEQADVPEDLLLQSAVENESHINLPADLLLQATVPEETKMSLPAEVLLTAAVEAGSGMELVDQVMLESPVSEVPKMELSEDNSMERVVRDQVLTVAAEIENLPPNSEISELESAVKFLQESEEQGIDSPLVLSPKMVDSVVDEIARVEDVGIFVTDTDICEDPSSLVAELENIIPDPIAISEAEIISEAAKLEHERKTKISEEAKLKSPILTSIEESESTLKVTESTPPPSVAQEVPDTIAPHPETPKTHREPRETVANSPKSEKVEEVTLLKKSTPIPKISILEERLKEPPKIEIPSVGEVSRICEMPTTPKTSLLIQRDAKLSSFQKMLESPKASEKTEHKIVDTPRKDPDKHDFENVGSPRIILKIAKSAIADCGEPRSPKSPKIRSATNSPNPEDSPGQKLGKIKLKLSKSGHPSIISNENVEEICGQWHTEGTSSLSPLGMKIKFSKTGDASIVPTEKHEGTEDSKEPPKHKFEEAKRTESPIGMKIKFSKTGDASIVQQDNKESTSKHKDKLDIMQGSPKRNESPLGMKIKFSKSGDASIIQPEKSESSEDHRESSSRGKDKLDVAHDVPRRTESPLGMKFKLFKTGDASIVASEVAEDSPPETKRNDSPLGMKIKLSKTRGSASIVPAESSDDVKERLEIPEVPRRTESPLGMKIKFSKSGDASIIHSDDTKDTAKHKERAEGLQESPQGPEAPIGVKIKVTKSRNTSEASGEVESVQAAPKRAESSIGMKFKLSKTGDASIVHSEKQEHVDELKSKEKADNLQETSRKPDAAIGMKIKFSKTGDASIIQQQTPKKSVEPPESEAEQQKSSDTTLPMKIKLQKSGDASVADTEKKDKSAKRKETDSPLEMKIKLSKTGHPTIIACDNYGETSQRTKDSADSHKHKESSTLKEMPGMKMLKSIQPGIPGNRTELTIEPVQSRKSDVTNEASPKRKDVTISPVESKKAKLEAKISHMLPEVTIQPIMPREQKPIMFDSKASSISRQQMNVISQEISITQVRSNKAMDLSMTNKPKSLLAKNATTSANPDCEIIEHRPELIIVNENSNSSQDVMIIEEVPAVRGPEAKVPKKRGRPRRNPLPLVLTKPMQQTTTDPAIPKDPLALDDIPQVVPQAALQISPKMAPLSLPPKENERPKRSCSRQKSYAPPRRGRGRGGGRGKRKMEMEHMELSKKPRIDQDLTLIEQSTTALITIDESPAVPEISHTTSELYKALRQPPMDHKMANAMARVEAEQAVNEADLSAKDTRESLMDSRIKSHLDGVIENSMKKPAEPENFETEKKMSLESLCSSEVQTTTHLVSDEMEKTEMMIVEEKTIEKIADDAKDNKDTVSAQDQENWLTPSSIKLLDGRTEGNISNVQVIDEETRMSAESSSRSQTPARNMSLQAPETIVNEESQGSVLSTATTESEKVKVKNRRMEINFDPDEGPFTVDKVAEYEWPLDPTRKSETFMIQEQISHYLGVKSFKRKYPDLKRRMVDMEERNYLRENALVSEAMCDMGLTAVCSSEVLDIMCNDFPDQYEEYRKYIRERQMKEHSKKQKELTAAANAEKNRIDLAEMAVQSALSWNVGLNKARRESRKCSLDLQTFTIHVPKKQQKVEEESRQSHYPVALIPGQYTDYYREYTPAELRYYPLNTVLYGPMKPNERKLDSQSEGSQSDSDSDSSSDDSSSSSSDGTQDTEESQSTMDEVDVELSRQKEDIKSIKCKMCLKHLNKFSRSEVLIQCGTCNGYVHPSCIDLTLDMVPHIQAYAWQCTDCKTCAQCHDPADEDKMLFCDMCDRGYHIYCVGLRRVPQGRWHCQECAVCASCGSREAGGANSDRNSVAQWQHEYKKGDKNTRVYVSTLCVPCSKLCGDQGPDNRSEKLSV